MASPTESPATEHPSAKSSVHDLADDQADAPAPSLSKFQYAPLHTWEIRLLEITSVSDHDIVCEMQHFPVQNPPLYVALSYVWGDGGPDFQILVNDQLLGVSQHLYEGMRSISSFATRKGLRELQVWIDAICIDQSNSDEKSIQVPLMGEIYHTAELVVVWFGTLHGPDMTSFHILEWLYLFRTLADSARGSIEVRSEYAKQLEYLERLLVEAGADKASLKAFLEAMDIVHKYKEFPDTEAMIKKIEDSEHGNHLWPKDHELWLSLLGFLRHPWFSRIWTIQEVRLAKRAILLAEDGHVPWSFLSWYRHTLFQRWGAGLLYSKKTMHRTRLPSHPDVDLDMHEISKNVESSSDHEFHRLLAGIRLHRAKEPKDHIYGILGMLSENVRSQITIDYNPSISVEVVFKEALIAACNIEGGAAFWPVLMEAYTNISQELVQLPSWIPDFSSHVLKSIKQERGGFEISDQAKYKYKHLAYIEFSPSSSIAAIRGIRLDSVESVISITRTIDLQEDTISNDILDHIISLQSVHDMDTDIFWTLFGSKQHSWLLEMDSMFPSKDGDPRALPVWVGRFVFNRHVGLLTKVYHSFRNFVNLVHIHKYRNFAEAIAHVDASLNETPWQSLVAVIACLLSYTTGKHIFRTVAGRIGFAPIRIMPGHNICVIPGQGARLHILSSDRTKYITSLAHVHGFMESDLLDALPLNESEWELFRLH